LKIAIASGKGGTGKTSLSVNLASFLAKKQEIVLVDLDVEEPNSGIFIEGELIHSENKHKMIPEWIPDNCTLCGICQKVCNFHAVIKMGTRIMVFPQLCHSCYACSELCPTKTLPMIPQKIGELKHFRKKNLNFVESKLLIGEEQAVPLIKQTHSYIDKTFSDKILKIYDCPPGTSCPVIEATKDADFVILVTEPTPFGFHDLTLAVETMKELGKKIGVVINKFGFEHREVEDFCEKENIPILARIPNSRKIAELYSKGKLIYPEVEGLANQFENIISHIQEEVAK